MLTIRPESILVQWEENTEEINRAVAIKIIARLKQSLAINPLDANSHLLMARYYEGLANNKSNEYSKFAEKSYINAITYQPSWDYAWAKTANFYSNQSKFNQASFIYALSKAMLLGPYETKNQQVIIPLIFKHWPLLVDNEAKKKTSIKIINHALRYHKHATFVLNAAIKHEQQETLFPLITKQWQKDRLKKYLEKTIYDK